MTIDGFGDPDRYRSPRWLRWAAVAVVAGGILYASLLDPPTSGLAPLGPLGLLGMDKWLHALAYAALAGTVALALAPRAGTARVVVLAVIVSVAYGVGIEFAQAPLPERSFSVADMAADAVGVGVGVVGWRVGVGLVGRLRPASADQPEETA
jgi:VanZ family protein